MNQTRRQFIATSAVLGATVATAKAVTPADHRMTKEDFCDALKARGFRPKYPNSCQWVHQEYPTLICFVSVIEEFSDFWRKHGAGHVDPFAEVLKTYDCELKFHGLVRSGMSFDDAMGQITQAVDA